MSISERKRDHPEVEGGSVFYGFAIVNRDDEPVHDIPRAQMNEHELQRIVDIFNDPESGAGDKAPYRVVQLYFMD